MDDGNKSGQLDALWQNEADLVVAGAYGHTQFREWVLGGFCPHRPRARGAVHFSLIDWKGAERNQVQAGIPLRSLFPGFDFPYLWPASSEPERAQTEARVRAFWLE